MLDRRGDPTAGPGHDLDPFDADFEEARASEGPEVTRSSQLRSALRGRIERAVENLRIRSARTSNDDGSAQLAAAELATLSVAGLSRRRVLALGGAILVMWVVITFVQQVGDAAAITTRADDLRAANAALEARVAAAEYELIRIQGTDYVEQQARAYRLGTSKEIPFTLAADPPPLAADAPGSAAARVGASADGGSPLETWLSVLFGPLR